MSYPPPQDPQQQPPYWQQPAGIPQQPSSAPVPPYMVGPPVLSYGQVAPARPNKRKKLPIVLGGIGAVFLLCIGGTVIAASTDRGAENISKGAQSRNQTEPTSSNPTVQAATKAPAKPATVVPVEPVATKAPNTSFRKLTARDWKLIVKDPAAHAGRKVVVYGLVTQFDAATGTGAFLADAGFSANEEPSDTNTYFTGSSAELAELVEDDEFRAEVIVSGAESYETQVGGNTTVPKLQVVSIKVIK